MRSKSSFNKKSVSVFILAILIIVGGRLLYKSLDSLNSSQPASPTSQNTKIPETSPQKTSTPSNITSKEKTAAQKQRKEAAEKLEKAAIVVDIAASTAAKKTNKSEPEKKAVQKSPVSAEKNTREKEQTKISAQKPVPKTKKPQPVALPEDFLEKIVAHILQKDMRTALVATVAPSKKAEKKKIQKQPENIKKTLAAPTSSTASAASSTQDKASQKEPLQTKTHEADNPAHVSYFGFDKSRLSKKERKFLESFVAKLGNNVESIRVQGYTCSVGPKAYNQGLSERRADYVARAIRKLTGLAQGRIQVLGFGEANPAASNSTRSGRKKNRRAEIYITFKEITQVSPTPESLVSTSSPSSAQEESIELEENETIIVGASDNVTTEESPEEIIVASDAQELNEIDLQAIRAKEREHAAATAPKHVASVLAKYKYILAPASEPALVCQFSSNSSLLDKNDAYRLLAFAKLLPDHAKLLVAGHADAQGAAAANLAASQRRAEAVAAYINSLTSKINVKIIALGEYFPLQENTTNLGRSANRRVELYAVE